MTTILHMGNAFRALRRHQNLSIRELAKRAGVHRNTIQKLENGEQSVGVDICLLVAEGLQVEFSEIASLSEMSTPRTRSCATRLTAPKVMQHSA